MDTGNGKFVFVEADAEKALKAFDEKVLAEKERMLQDAYPNHGGWFREGEVVELKGSLFRVKRIKPTEITLKLLKRDTNAIR